MTKEDVCELKKLLKDLIGEIRALRVAPVQYHYHYEYPQVRSPYVYPTYPITTPYPFTPYYTTTMTIGDHNNLADVWPSTTHTGRLNGTSPQI